MFSADAQNKVTPMTDISSFKSTKAAPSNTGGGGGGGGAKPAPATATATPKSFDDNSEII